MDSKKIYVTSPVLPPLEDYYKCLVDIWDRKWITNNGYYHQELEKALSQYLGIRHISLFTNGTLPIITALRALEISGEVITTPYSFVATTHSLLWNKIKPVFVDIDPITFNINPDRIEEAITSETKAILAVHVYGLPCDNERIQSIADKYGLKVIYDAAHAFGVTVNGRSILEFGDMSTLSFHATKVYNTAEGGALIVKDAHTKEKIDYFKNFGFASETEVVALGINSKMDEIRAAYGLLNLKQVDNFIAERKRIASYYGERLKGVEGITTLRYDDGNVRYNYAYYPIFVDEGLYGMTRDQLYYKLRDHNIYGRRYFYPLISDFSMYNHLDSSRHENLMVAKMVASQVICLPIYPGLSEDDIERIVSIIDNNN